MGFDGMQLLAILLVMWVVFIAVVVRFFTR